MRSLKLLCGVLLSSAGLAAVACEYPSLPDIPADGRLRGRAERVVKEDMIRYINAMSAYVACVQAELRAAESADAPALHQSLVATRSNTAVAELVAVRDVYVERVGPLEELFFAVPPDLGDWRGGRRITSLGTVQRARPEDVAFGRIESSEGGAQCMLGPICSTAVTHAGPE